MKCANCGKENPDTNIRCEFCGQKLQQMDNKKNINNNVIVDEKTMNKAVKKLKMVITTIILIVLMPFFVIEFFTIINYSKELKSEDIQSKNYIKTVGIQISEDKYEYTVDGVTYTGSPNLLGRKNEKTTTVKYNPDNPEEYVMSDFWKKSIAFIILVIFIELFIAIVVPMLLLKTMTRSKK